MKHASASKGSLIAQALAKFDANGSTLKPRPFAFDLGSTPTRASIPPQPPKPRLEHRRLRPPHDTSTSSQATQPGLESSMAMSRVPSDAIDMTEAWLWAEGVGIATASGSCCAPSECSNEISRDDDNVLTGHAESSPAFDEATSTTHDEEPPVCDSSAQPEGKARRSYLDKISSGGSWGVVDCRNDDKAREHIRTTMGKYFEADRPIPAQEIREAMMIKIVTDRIRDAYCQHGLQWVPHPGTSDSKAKRGRKTLPRHKREEDDARNAALFCWQ